MADEKKDLKPGVVAINAASKKTGKTVSAEVNIGATLDDAIKLFGDKVVYSMYKAKMVIAFQDAGRRILADPDKTPEEALKAVQEFKPGVAKVRTGGPRKSPIQKLDEKIAAGEVSKDELLALQAKIAAAIAAKKSA